MEEWCGKAYLLRNCSRPCLRSSMKFSSNIPSSPRKGNCLNRAFPGRGGTTTWGSRKKRVEKRIRPIKESSCKIAKVLFYVMLHAVNHNMDLTCLNSFYLEPFSQFMAAEANLQLKRLLCWNIQTLCNVWGQIDSIKYLPIWSQGIENRFELQMDFNKMFKRCINTERMISSPCKSTTDPANIISCCTLLWSLCVDFTLMAYLAFPL